MSLLEIVLFPDERLRRVATDVTQFDAHLARVTDQMMSTMYASRGVGLAATQVDVHQRFFVADCADEAEPAAPMVFINPIIIDRAGLIESEEGCLSIPDINDKVMRSESVTVRAQSVQGASFELTTGGLLAVCIQHEIDHLNGKLFIDYLSPLKQQRIRKKLEKAHRQKALDAKDFL